MPRLALSLLGRPRIERDGVAVEISHRKTIALLTYLAVTGEAHHREKLAALLWPRHPRDKARAALRRTLTEIRHAIGEEWVSADGDMVGLQTNDGLWLDVEQFNALSSRLEEAARSGEDGPDLSLLKQVVELYRSDFLSEFLLDTNTTFSEWQYFQAEALRKRVIATLDQLVEGHVDGGEHGLAIAYARRRLDLDPVAENAHRQLMRLYAVTGQHSLAVRQYRDCSRRLVREIGVEPAEETERLYHDVLARRPVVPKEPAAKPPANAAAPSVRSPPVPHPHPMGPTRPGSRPRSRWLVPALAAAALAVVAAIYFSVRALTVQPPSIALVALGGDAPGPESRTFTSGVEETLLTALAGLPGLVVRPGIAQSSDDAAAKLHVSYLIEGSVFEAGDRVRISLRLVDARHDRILWADRFDGTLDDPLGIQASAANQAAVAVAEALGLD